MIDGYVPVRDDKPMGTPPHQGSGATLPEWAFKKACTLADRRPGHIRSMTEFNSERKAIEALASYIAAHEQPPVDRKLLCAREAYRAWASTDTTGLSITDACIRAIELWIEGYGE